MIQTTEWAKIWNALDSKKLMHDDVGIMLDELNRYFRGAVTDAEIESAVRSLCEMRRAGKDENGDPVPRRFMERLCGNSLITLIRRERFRARNNGAKPGDACACSDGWIYCEPSTGKYAGTTVAYPCLCAQGQVWLQRYYPTEHQAHYIKVAQEFWDTVKEHNIEVIKGRMFDFREEKIYPAALCGGMKEAEVSP